MQVMHGGHALMFADVSLDFRLEPKGMLMS